MVNVMLEIRKNGCGCGSLSLGVGLRAEFINSANWKWGLCTLTPKQAHPNPILSVFQKWPREAGQRSCDLARFIRGLSFRSRQLSKPFFDLEPKLSLVPGLKSRVIRYRM
jgi:hypothetical protein